MVCLKPIFNSDASFFSDREKTKENKRLRIWDWCSSGRRAQPAWVTRLRRDARKQAVDLQFICHDISIDWTASFYTLIIAIAVILCTELLLRYLQILRLKSIFKNSLKDVFNIDSNIAGKFHVGAKGDNELWALANTLLQCTLSPLKSWPKKL